MSEQKSEEKPFEASAQKLLEARKKGELAKSADLGTAAAYLALVIAIAILGFPTVQQFGTSMHGVLSRAAALSHADLMQSGGWLGPMVRQALFAFLPLLLLPAAAALLCYAVQRAIVFAPSKLWPKISRISLVSNAKNKFGISGLFEFGKSCLKLLAYAVCLGLLLHANLPSLGETLWLAPAIGLHRMFATLLQFLTLACGIMLLIGAVDFLWQRHLHLHRQRMTAQEVKEELKRNEGDPQIKQQRRQKAVSIAANNMMQEVPRADVVVVNPTHYAVALKWSRKPGEVPICVAKGVDEIAARIRQRAMEHGVPIHADPPTARALFASTDLGAPIQPDHYRAVAAAIRFAEAMRQRAQSRSPTTHQDRPLRHDS